MRLEAQSGGVDIDVLASESRELMKLKTELKDARRKIEWHVENQALVEKHGVKVAAQAKEIARLKGLLRERGNGTRSKRRIADLEAQLKEMEEAVRFYHQKLHGHSHSLTRLID